MKISMGQITILKTPMEESVLACERAGFENIELAFPVVNSYLENHTAAQLRSLFDAHRLRAVSAIGLAPQGVAALYARGEAAEKYFAALEEQMAFCRTMGCELINIGSESDEYAYEGYEAQAVENLRRAGSLGAKYGLKVAFEDGKMDRCLPLVYAADHPQVGFCVDFFWYFKHGYTARQLMAYNMDKLFNIHFCDLPEGFDAKTMDDSIRVLPGQGVLPLEKWMRWLSARGYGGYCCLELLNEPVWEMEPGEACGVCMEAMKPYLEI